MTGSGVGAALVGCILAGTVLTVSGFGSFMAALAIDVEENGPTVPPELEATYRQVAYATGVPWTALAAWDGAENRFDLPIPLVEEIYRQRMEAEVQRRRQEAEAWCQGQPDDVARCPPRGQALSPDEQVSIWRGAQDSYHSRRRSHVEGHARILLPLMADFEVNPSAVYARLVGQALANRAEELFMAYEVLMTTGADSDSILVDAPLPPADWTPVAGFAWPASAPITSRFGMRVSPVDGRYRLHAGIDLGVATGEPIGASKAGRVVRAEPDGVYGLVVVLEHEDGYTTLYAHCSRLFVKAGQAVDQGQALGAAGSTGLSTGPHLHFEVHYHGAPVDPLLLLTHGS